MASKTCVACGSLIELRADEYKMLDQSGPFVCSIRCVYRWIVNNYGYDAKRDPKAFVSALDRGDAYYSESLRTYFRARTEGLLAEQLVHRWHVRLEYEPYVYKVGKGSYNPDFYFPEYGCFIEAKGVWEASNRSKLKKFRDAYPCIQLLVVPWPLLQSLL